MRKEEYSKSPEDLDKIFDEWYEDGIPAPKPSPAEADRSIREPVPADLSLPTDTDHLNRRRVDNPQKLFWL